MTQNTEIRFRLKVKGANYKKVNRKMKKVKKNLHS